MPVISEVGRKTPKTRAAIIGIYLVLLLGAVTMIYPFWLVIIGSISGWEAVEYRLYPRFLFNEGALFEAHILKKYYFCHDAQWKVRWPNEPNASKNPWQLIPGAGGPPRSNTALGKVLMIRNCENTFSFFQRDYEALGMPKEWTPEFTAIVQQRYPFAVSAVETMVKSDKLFVLDRRGFLEVIRREYHQRLDSFMDDYTSAGQPGYRSSEFADLMKRYSDLSISPDFVSVMQDYSLSRKPDLEDERVIRQTQDYDEFRATLPLSHRAAYWLHNCDRVMVGNKLYWRWLHDKYGTLDALNKAYRMRTVSWHEMVPLNQIDNPALRSWFIEDSALNRDWVEFKNSLPAHFIMPKAIEFLWSGFLSGKYGDNMDELNIAWGTHYLRFLDIPLPERAPSEPDARACWEEYVRNELPLDLMRFDGGTDLWRQYLLKRLGSPSAINSQLSRSYRRVQDIQLPYLNAPTAYDPDDPYWHIGYPPTKQEYDLLREFVSSEMPLQYIRVLSSENLYRNWLAQKYGSVEEINKAYGTSAESVGDMYFPMQAVDWKDVTDHSREQRWEVITRGYERAVNVLVHQRRSLWNTIVYVALAIITTLMINPMCAYALSRFKLPGSYNILLFLLATMAFPAEVTMIPNFLLLRNFPLLNIICVILCFLAGISFGLMLLKNKPIKFTLIAGLLGALLGGLIVAPIVTTVAPGAAGVSLLNTYWALVLPGVASGYSIFILKGFFDSLPAELYEAASLDGAGELRLFLQITLPMCKPVMAVIALWTFTAAYGSFMWAMVICQDPKMWTIMVHIYQQQLYTPDLNEYHALLLFASLPTLLVFIAVQRVILKGIVLPSYK